MITWLASYPKSGNTWVRAFLAAYSHRLNGNRSDFGFQMIGAVSDSDSVASRFAEAAGKSIEELDGAEIDSLREPVQQEMARFATTSRVVKTHNARVSSIGQTHICDAVSYRAIYLVRNPLDIIDSMADHMGCRIDDVIASMSNPDHSIGLDSGLIPQRLDTWSQHVVSWADQDAFPVLVIRYEELLRVPRLMFSQIVQFLEWDLNDETIDWALQQTSFGNLQRLESERGFPELSPKSREKRFFRRGRQNVWPVVLSRTQAEQIVREHQRAIQIAGYEIPDIAAIYADPELPKRKEIYRAAKQAQLEVAERRARERAAATKSTTNSVDTRLPKAIARGLIEGENPDRIITELSRQGLPEKLVSDAVGVANSHLYIEAAREIVSELRTEIERLESAKTNVQISEETTEAISTEPAKCPVVKMEPSGVSSTSAEAEVSRSEDSVIQHESKENSSERLTLSDKDMSFVAYEIYPVKDMPLVPAPINRDWMDNTQKRFAYRCLPLTLANQAGWLVCCPSRFAARWNGGPRVEDVTLFFDEGVKETRISSLFGHGTFTVNMPYLFRTPRDVNLWVKGPTNSPKDGVSPLEGLVETDWTNASFTMNWKLTRPGQLVRFEAGDPICMVVPFPRGFLDALNPLRRSLKSNPDMHAKYMKWSHDRNEFQDKVALGDEEAVKRGWQKDYFQGRDPGADKFDGHQTKLGLEPFQSDPNS